MRGCWLPRIAIHATSARPWTRSTVTKRNWMPFHLKMRRPLQFQEVTGSGAGEVSQAARQLRHNSPRTYNQTIAIIINRYTFNDRVCRTRLDVGLIFRAQATMASASSKFSCYIRLSEAVGYFVTGWELAKTAQRGGMEGVCSRTELAQSMICGAVSVHLATAGRQGITHRNKDRKPCVTV